VSKLITLLLLVVLGVYLFKRMVAKRAAQDSGTGQKPAEDMVKCRTCGVNMPRSEAILSQGRFYCCDEHRRADS
jgi:uncharacterized protein